MFSRTKILLHVRERSGDGTLPSLATEPYTVMHLDAEEIIESCDMNIRNYCTQYTVAAQLNVWLRKHLLQ